MSRREDDIRQLAELLRDIPVAMFTTVAMDGRLVSRPLGTQEVEFDGDLWFVTAASSPKIAEIAANPRVNVAYAAPDRNTYVSVAGRAEVLQDRARVERYWSPAMQVFFPGGKDDPELRLIHVRAESAEYWNSPAGLFGAALQFVLGAVDEEQGVLSENRVVDLRRG
ncbi:pyridoxamine 5'-phosphate oxidase family protein [Stenotrophomonas sp. HITSZ_GD]|uniref:pyridoxamine 5'-phosphate oxidase family protein n=1 Tax=Stenotrophomonas sp. HITSZ_GD TaxID=3037248 RepID=UPI00240E755E|nr:pyridoxamine 5'-phosphate oxidase family protein [Stenotrophomonas sp. HITSZ_GD]MDG2526602.1 pyridoxamine 5'-phosphate oxidase family protein [Stenotrophomonas sp. HITSZ_GD]